jgi:choline dehydrogenase-like flavoprotein
MKIRAEAVVVGSGAGGGAAALALAEAGREVVVVEMGERQRPSTFTQREEQMFPRLFQDGAARTTADRTVQVLQGKGVGGSTLHNLNLCKRIDDALLAVWEAEQSLPNLTERLRPHYDAIGDLLRIVPVPEERVNRNNALLRAGAQALGWRNGPLQHNREGCVGSGFCELGCAYDAKNNSARILLPAAERRGARVLSGATVHRIVHRFGRAVGVRGEVITEHGREPLEIDADRVVLAASATGTAALVLASGLPDPYRQAGRGLALHPGATVGALFADPVNAWRGIPQSWECTELLDPLDPLRRCWIVPVFGHPVGVGAMLPGIGAMAMRRMGSYAHIAACTPMLHDITRGVVTADRAARPTLHYTPCPDDLTMMARGLSAAARIYLAAGALEVLIPTAVPRVVRTDAEARALADLRLGAHDPPLAAVHPMGGMRIGGDSRNSAVNADGQHHQVKGLWVADGSLFPSSTGVPPQWSIYAFGRLVGTAAAA